MLGLQGNSSSPKVYRCVACSATFNGLASLLVHQATHAGTLEKLPVHSGKDPGSSHDEAATSNKELSKPSPPTSFPESPALYICDCGDEFHDFNQMLEHKRSHVSTTSDNSRVQLAGEKSEKVAAAEHKPHESSLKPVMAISHPPTSGSSPSVTAPVLDGTLLEPEIDNGQTEGVTTVETPQEQNKTVADPSETNSWPTDCDLSGKIPSTQEPSLQVIQAELPKDADSVPSNTIPQSDTLPRNQTLMKMLATAYMKRCQAPHSQNASIKSLIPKSEVIPVEITQEKADTPANMESSVDQFRRLLAKPGIKTKSPGVGRILDSSSKSIVSLTRTFSPVVVLETRQKLIDTGNNGKHGRYQCGRCRRVFQDLDNLTEHHSLHRKEKIKCCRHCKQLIIGKPPFPDNHVCPQLSGKATQASNSTQSKYSFGGKLGPFHNVKKESNPNSPRKVFYCPLCKHNYSRRYNLKMHKCQARSLRSNTSPNSTPADILASLQTTKHTGVSTDPASKIKIEVTSSNSVESGLSGLAWFGTPKSFPPFSSKVPVLEDHEDATPSKDSEQQNEMPSAVCTKKNNGGQWTMPLDDEIEVLSSTEDVDNDAHVKKQPPIGHAVQNTSLPFFIRDGVKRYPCNRCHKTYSRQSTLRRHLRLCGFRPRGFGTVQPKISKVKPIFGALAQPPNAQKVKPMFDCFVCGKSFNRKDNMLVHTKRCQLKRGIPGLNSGPQSVSSSDGQNLQDNEGNWGIMSLPSVLPRRVTCECGAGFTSPRLLLEHLQKHAQESYTCPTCGETVSSWADYELHLQIHMHPHHQLYKGLQPQRSQPLLLRFQQQPLQQQTAQAVCPPPSKKPSVEQIPNPNKKQQRIPCTRCNNTFSSRCSLRKHISLNRCKGGRGTNHPKANHCSRCNADFPNIMSLVFHQRSGNCKPAFKPMRCTVCFRWFSTMDGLQKHLLTHNQSESYQCDVCQGTYPNLNSLKNHRRRIHRIMAGDTMPITKQEQLNS